MEEQLGSLAKEGVLGVMLALSLGLNFWLINRLLSQMEKRVEAANKINEQLATPITNIDKTLALLNDKVVASKGGQ